MATVLVVLTVSKADATLVGVVIKVRVVVLAAIELEIVLVIGSELVSDAT